MGLETRLNAMRNLSVSPLALAVQGPGTVVGAGQINLNGRGLVLVVDTTVFTNPGTCTINVYGDDPVSGKKYLLLASAALAAVATTILRIYPGLTAAANLVASDVLPTNWHVEAVVAGAGAAVTATIAGHTLSG